MIFKGFNFKSERAAIAIIRGAAANTLVCWTDNQLKHAGSVI